MSTSETNLLGINANLKLVKSVNNNFSGIHCCVFVAIEELCQQTDEDLLKELSLYLESKEETSVVQCYVLPGITMVMVSK